MINFLFLVNSLDEDTIYKEYIKPFNINPKEVSLLKLYQDPVKKKTSATLIKEFINSDLKDKLAEINPKYILVCDSDYFKVLTKKSKTEPYLGYVLKSAYSDHKVLYVPNFKSIFYNPSVVRSNIKVAIENLLKDFNGTYTEPGSNIIHSAKYPLTPKEIKETLQELLDMNKPLSCDIEAFSLKHYDAGIGTITFCWDEHNGVAFPVDLNPATGLLEGPQYRNEEVRNLLRWFFENFNNTLLFHNIAYDVYVLIYQLYMKDLLDFEGLNKGLNILLKNWEDTKLITYLATNSCAGNDLSLKTQSQEFAGNYAQEEIKDIRKILLKDLLEYNLTDGLSTWYTYNKHWNNMVKDNQLDIYTNIFKPATIDIIQMQLTGMPLNMDKVKEVKLALEDDQEEALKKILSNPVINDYENHLNQKWVEKRNAKLKKKKVTIAEANEKFNPNSDKQLQELLYGFLSLPVIEYTESKQPATGAEVLENLKNHTTNPSTLLLLDGLVDLKAVSKILTAFIPAFENAQKASDGRYYLFGNLNLGGTVSGRLSSNNPNMQNLPATGSKYAKPIKSCFQAPDGWLFVGLDFASLEDHISALTTKDKNKLKVYIDHYDGHCLRAYSYWKDLMPDITEALNKNPEKEVEIINSIKEKHKDLRQRSKGCTFALTYAGTWITLKKNFGFSEEEAKHIEKQYHELYKESDLWVQNKLNKAVKDGYVTGAFGLRVRTPILKQVIRNNSKTPKEAEAEGRTAGNALGQSWGLLNTRAGIEFNNLVRNSKFKYNIRPMVHIHDAQYFLIKDDADTLLFLNENLVKAVKWQEHPDISHDKVHLGGEVSIFYPDWAHELVLPNKIDEENLVKLVNKYKESLCQKT